MPRHGDPPDGRRPAARDRGPVRQRIPRLPGVAGGAGLDACMDRVLPAAARLAGFDPTIGEPTSLKHVVVGSAIIPAASCRFRESSGGRRPTSWVSLFSVQTSTPLDRVAE